jgi:aminoglycoside phosphotransferase (APT) family kinase protein
MESATKNRQSREDIVNMVQQAFGNHLRSEDIELKELTEGFYNVAYEITLPEQSVILKIAPPQDAKVLGYEANIMEAEVEGLRLVETNTDIPVPHVFFYDDSRQCCRSPYFFMEKLSGDSLFKLRDDLTHQEKELIIEELGGLNAGMNQLQGQKFGYLGQPEKQRSTWKETFLSMIEEVLVDGENIEISLGDGVEYEQVRKLVEKAASALEQVTIPSFVHWDLWEGNVFVYDKKIIALIDFERSLWGDPLMEYYFRRHSNRPSFNNGYGADLRAEAPIRALLYDLYLYLIMVIETKYRNYPDDGQYQFASKELKTSMEELTRLV